MIVDAQPDMTVVAEAIDGRSALARAHEAAPDIVVMDVSMPKLNGLRATALLRDQCPATKVLALTRHREPGYLRELLRAGASGYVLKQSSSADLLRAIRAVAAGGTYIDPTIAHQVVAESYTAYPSRRSGRATGTVTPREDEVIRLVALGYTNKDIAARLSLSVKTVETHKAKAMQKLGLESRMDVVRYAHVQGWFDEA